MYDKLPRPTYIHTRLLHNSAGYVIKELQEKCKNKPAAMVAAAHKALR